MMFCEAVRDPGFEGIRDVRMRPEGDELGERGLVD